MVPRKPFTLFNKNETPFISLIFFISFENIRTFLVALTMVLGES